MGNKLVQYTGNIQLEFDAYDIWKDHTGHFQFFFPDDDDRKLCLCKREQPERSCIIIELKVSADDKCFVQCKKYNIQRTQLPRERQQSTHPNWNLGTALYACHTFATREYSSINRADITSKKFARELVGYMVNAKPSDDAIKNPIDDVRNLMKWSNQLGITMNVVSNAQLL